MRKRTTLMKFMKEIAYDGVEILDNDNRNTRLRIWMAFAKIGRLMRLPLFLSDILGVDNVLTNNSFFVNVKIFVVYLTNDYVMDCFGIYMCFLVYEKDLLFLLLYMYAEQISNFIKKNIQLKA
ncbi:hypothetical protein HanLR1_Chr14g0534031 [Helianthus annuus]|nr:hypothetical protein HanHA89_Chr14g0571631 [Helianthus annuus]KAJ0656286.1 hypothetical protein HanLR1_Chr14g0534031 [Helianthus annuus]